MDIYEATQALLVEAVPGVNVSAYVLTYDADVDKYLLPDFPAVTYNYNAILPVIDMGGGSDLFRITLDVEVWGDLGQINTNANLIMDALNAQRIRVENVEFTVVMAESRDIAELGLDFKRRLMRFVGMAEISEVEDDESR